MLAYNSFINSLIAAQNALPGTRIVGGQLQVETGLGANPSVAPITGLNVNPQNLQSASGLFALEPGTQLFRGAPAPSVNQSLTSDVIGVDRDG